MATTCSSAGPAPSGVVAGIAACALAPRRQHKGYGLLILTILYLCHAEFLGARGRDIHAPAPPVGESYHRWSLTFNSCEHDFCRPCKTGEFDESLLSDLPRHHFLQRVLANLRQERPAIGPFFNSKLARCCADWGGRAGVQVPLAAAVVPVAPHRRLPGLGDRGFSIPRSEAQRQVARGRVTPSLGATSEPASRCGVFRQLPEPARAYCAACAGELPYMISGTLAPCPVHVG